MQMVARADREAFTCLMTRHKQMVYNLAYRQTGNEHEADDICQETFLRVWNSKDYRPTAKFTTWLYTIAYNCIVSRSRHSWNQRVELKEPDNEHWDTTDTPEEAAMRRERIVQIQNAVARLPENQRVAIVLKRYDDLSYQEIATIMNCTVSAVDSLLIRAKKNLQEYLSGL